MWWRRKNKEVATLVVTDATFDELVRQSPLPVLIDFHATWCGPCKVLGPIVDELASDYASQVRVVKVDVDGNPNLSARFKIKSIPTLAFVKNGRLIEMISGMVSKPNLAEMLDDLIAFEVVVDEEE